jgi:hypothetical protein
MMHRKREGQMDDWTLRAKREKAMMKAESDVMWEEAQKQLMNLDQLNLTELNDARAIHEWSAPAPALVPAHAFRSTEHRTTALHASKPRRFPTRALFLHFHS